MFGFNYSKSSHASFIPCPLYHNLFIDNKIQNTYTVWPRFISSMPALATWTSLEPLVWSSVSTFFPLLSIQLPARFFEKINLIRSLCGSKSSLSPSVLKMAYKPHPTPIISLIFFPVLSTSQSITTTLASLFPDCTITSEPLHKPLHRCNLPHRHHPPQEAYLKTTFLKITTQYSPLTSAFPTPLLPLSFSFFP